MGTATAQKPRIHIFRSPKDFEATVKRYGYRNGDAVLKLPANRVIAKTFKTVECIKKGTRLNIPLSSKESRRLRKLILRRLELVAEHAAMQQERDRLKRNIGRKPETLKLVDKWFDQSVKIENANHRVIKDISKFIDDTADEAIEFVTSSGKVKKLIEKSRRIPLPKTEKLKKAFCDLGTSSGKWVSGASLIKQSKDLVEKALIDTGNNAALARAALCDTYDDLSSPSYWAGRVTGVDIDDRHQTMLGKISIEHQKTKRFWHSTYQSLQKSLDRLEKDFMRRNRSEFFDVDGEIRGLMGH